MGTPQQPELRRASRTPADPDSREAREPVEGDTTSQGRTGPVPEDNRPGHHPEREQDRPAALGGAGHGGAGR